MSKKNPDRLTPGQVLLCALVMAIMVAALLFGPRKVGDIELKAAPRLQATTTQPTANPGSWTRQDVPAAYTTIYNTWMPDYACRVWVSTILPDLIALRAIPGNEVGKFDKEPQKLTTISNGQLSGSRDRTFAQQCGEIVESRPGLPDHVKNRVKIYLNAK